MSQPLQIPDDRKRRGSLSPESPNSKLLIPSPIITRRTRTQSTSDRAFENPLQHGTVKSFCRNKGHGFITPDIGEEDLFVHISDIEGEYVPLPGDKVKFRLCPIPPKYEKNQAVHVQIVDLTPEVHIRWDHSLSTVYVENSLSLIFLIHQMNMLVRYIKCKNKYL